MFRAVVLLPLWFRVVIAFAMHNCHCISTTADRSAHRCLLRINEKRRKRTILYVHLSISIYVSIRLECNFEDIDISRFQLWFLLRLHLQLDLMLSYSILFLFSLVCMQNFCYLSLYLTPVNRSFCFVCRETWTPVISCKNVNGRKNDKECNICSRACKPKKNVSSFTSFFYWKIYKWIGAWCQLVLSLVHGVYVFMFMPMLLLLMLPLISFSRRSEVNLHL